MKNPYLELIFIVGNEYRHTFAGQINAYLLYLKYRQNYKDNLSHLSDLSHLLHLYLCIILSAKFYEDSGLLMIRQLYRDIILRKDYLQHRNLISYSHYHIPRSNIVIEEIELLKFFNYQVKIKHFYIRFLEIIPFFSRCFMLIDCWKQYLIRDRQISPITLILAIKLLQRHNKLKVLKSRYYYYRTMRIFDQVQYNFDLTSKQLWSKFIKLRSKGK